jgi:hypothetical protein
MADTYFVYYDQKRHRGTIHLSDCGHCNNGQGKVGALAHNWRGPFDRNEAARTLKEIKQADQKANIQPCTTCNP